MTETVQSQICTRILCRPSLIMVPSVFWLVMLASNVVLGQDPRIDFSALLGGRDLYQGLGGYWLKPVTTNQNRRVYKSLVSTTAVHSTQGPPALPNGLPFQVHPVCNYTTCCSRRTSDSVARRASGAAIRLGASAPPTLLACGPSPGTAGAASAPCHPPLGDQPALRAFRTRVQLSLHVLHQTLAQLGTSAAAALSATGAFTPSAWAAFLPTGLKQNQRLLSLAPAPQAHSEQLPHAPQHSLPVDAAGPNGGGAALAVDVGRDAAADEAGGPAAAENVSHGWEAVESTVEAAGGSVTSRDRFTARTGSPEIGEGVEADTPPSGSDGFTSPRGNYTVEGDTHSWGGDHNFPGLLELHAEAGNRIEPFTTRDDSSVVPAVEGAGADVELMSAEPVLADEEPYNPWLGAEASGPHPELSSMTPRQEDYLRQAEDFRSAKNMAATSSGPEVGEQWGGENMGLTLAEAAAGTEPPHLTSVANDLIQTGEDTPVAEAKLMAAPSAESEALDSRGIARAALHVSPGPQFNEVGLKLFEALEPTEQEQTAQSSRQEDWALVDLQAEDNPGVFTSGDAERTMRVTEEAKTMPWQLALESALRSLSHTLSDVVPGDRGRSAADMLKSFARQSLTLQLEAPDHTVAVGVAVAAVLVAFVQTLAVWTARRQARDLRVALEGLETQVTEARYDVKRQVDARTATVRMLAASARERTAAAVQIAQQVSVLQVTQAELTAALVSAVRDWRARGQVLTATLGRCRRRAERLAQMAAVERVTAQGELRLQMEAVERLAVTDRLRHAQELAELRQRLEKELDFERQRHSATAAAAQKRCAQYEAALRDQRRRNGRNLAAWLALRSWLGLQVQALSERAAKLAAEHSAALAEANSVVERHRMRVAIVKQQLADQVAVVVEANRTNDELVQLLGEKDSVILELEGELAATTAALESQRQQRDDVQQALTSTEDSLSSAQRKAAALRAEFQEARAAAKDAEARAEQLADANAMLEQQISQFVKTVNLLAEMEEVNLAPIRAQAAALERQLAADREAAAAAVAERDAKLAEAAAELAEARREAEAAQRARGEVAKRLEECERELQTLQLELTRIEEEGPDSAVAFSSKQPSLRDQHHGDHRDRDQEAVLQQLLGPLVGLTPLPLPPDSRTLLASPASASVAAGGSLMSVADRGGAGGSSSGARGAGALSFGATSGLRK